MVISNKVEFEDKAMIVTSWGQKLSWETNNTEKRDFFLWFDIFKAQRKWNDEEWRKK